MAYVKAKPNESIDQLLKRFKKKVEQSGVLSDFRKREFYEKPSVKRKRKQAAARKRYLKRMRKFRPRPKGGNWKWNKYRTKKIPLRSYAKNSGNKPRYNNKTGNKPYKSRNKDRRSDRNQRPRNSNSNRGSNR